MSDNGHDDVIEKLQKLIDDKNNSLHDVFTQDDIDHLKDIIDQHKERPDYWHETNLKMTERHHTLRRMGSDFYKWIIGVSLILIATTNITTKIWEFFTRIIQWII